jgi:hypothetical protein
MAHRSHGNSLSDQAKNNSRHRSHSSTPSEREHSGQKGDYHGSDRPTDPNASAPTRDFRRYLRSHERIGRRIVAAHDPHRGVSPDRHQPSVRRRAVVGGHSSHKTIGVWRSTCRPRCCVIVFQKNIGRTDVSPVQGAGRPPLQPGDSERAGPDLLCREGATSYGDRPPPFNDAQALIAQSRAR